MNENRSHTLALLLIVLALPVAAVLPGCALASCATSRVAAAAPLQPDDQPLAPQFPVVDYIARENSWLTVHINPTPGETGVIVYYKIFEDASIGAFETSPAQSPEQLAHVEHFIDWSQYILNRVVDDPCWPKEEPRYSGEMPGGFGRILTGTILADEAEAWRAEISPDPWGEWDPAGPRVCYRSFLPLWTR